MNFEDFPDPVSELDRMMTDSLRTLYEELVVSECYVREHEVVNLFVFGHLVPLFQRHNLDLRQIGIEYPVSKIVERPKSKPGARKDLVIWPKVGATRWNNHKPIAVVEWKHISRITPQPTEVRKAYLKDIEWLTVNREMMLVGFAILVERTKSGLGLECARVLGGVSTTFLKLPLAASASS